MERVLPPSRWVIFRTKAKSLSRHALRVLSRLAVHRCVLSLTIR